MTNKVTCVTIVPEVTGGHIFKEAKLEKKNRQGMTNLTGARSVVASDFLCSRPVASWRTLISPDLGEKMRQGVSLPVLELSISKGLEMPGVIPRKSIPDNLSISKRISEALFFDRPLVFKGGS